MQVIHCPNCNKVIRKLDDPKDGEKHLEYCEACKTDFVLLVKLELKYFVEKNGK